MRTNGDADEGRDELVIDETERDCGVIDGVNTTSDNDNSENDDAEAEDAYSCIVDGGASAGSAATPGVTSSSSTWKEGTEMNVVMSVMSVLTWTEIRIELLLETL